MDELESLFGEDDIPKGDFRPDDYTFHLKPRGIGPYREKYRPQKFGEVVSTCSVEQLRNQVDNPGASQIFIFEGSTGTGKTTCARILARALICNADNTYDKPCLECKNCKRFDKNPIDLLELNTADKNKVDDMRNLVIDMKTMAAQFSKKIYILDEVQRLTKDAQQVLLTELEEPHQHLLIFLCTTDIGKIDKALVDRACRVNFSKLTPQQALDIINQVITHEGLTASDEIKEAFYFQSRGSVRRLLNNLQAFSQGGFDPTQQEEDEVAAEVNVLYKAITSGDWPKLSSLLAKSNVRRDAEGLRIGLENYFRAVLLKKSNMDEAIKHGNAMMRISGTLISPEITGHSVYNNFILKCLRACAVYK